MPCSGLIEGTGVAAQPENRLVHFESVESIRAIHRDGAELIAGQVADLGDEGG